MVVDMAARSSSMADHLKHLHPRSPKEVDLKEPLPTMEQVERLIVSFNSDIPVLDYLSEVRDVRPLSAPYASFPVTLETGDFFKGVPVTDIMKSFLKDNGNKFVGELLEKRAFGVVQKQRRGNLMFMVTTEEAQTQLYGKKINIMGKTFRFKSPSPFAKWFFLDVTGVPNWSAAEKVAVGLDMVNARPVYFYPCAIDAGTGLSSSTWRFYFPVETAPQSLMKNGYVIQSIQISSQSYLVRGKDSDTPPMSQRDKRSLYGINLSCELPRGQPSESRTTDSADEGVEKRYDSSFNAIDTSKCPSSGNTGETFEVESVDNNLSQEDNSIQDQASVLTSENSSECVNFNTRSEESKEEENERSLSDLHPEHHASCLVDNAGQSEIGPDGDTVMELPPPLLRNGEEEDEEMAFVVAGVKRTLSDSSSPRNCDPHSPRKLGGATIESSNYYAVLDEIDCEIEVVESTEDESMNGTPPFQLIPTVRDSLKVPKKQKKKLRKNADDSDHQDDALLKEVQVALTEASVAARNEISSDYVAMATKKVAQTRALLETSKNADALLTSMVNTPLAWCMLFARLSKEETHLIDELSTLHAFHRVLLANYTPFDHTFAKKVSSLHWEKTTTREGLLDRVKAAMTVSEEIEQVWEQHKALGFFEIMILTWASNTFYSNEWLSYLCKQSIAEGFNDWYEVNVLTSNISSLRKNGKEVIKNHLQNYSIICLQESRLKDCVQAQSFMHAVQENMPSKVFINDPNASIPTTSSSRRGGVITIIQDSLSCAATAQEVLDVSIPRRYLLVKMIMEQREVYIHNVYAPNEVSERAKFFASLPREFESQSLHIVCGDFNVAIDRDKDATYPRPHSSRDECNEWLSHLRVIDAWRLHHPEERVFSGPVPRCNRLDYIFMSDEICTNLYKSSDYKFLAHGGDHLAHEVCLTRWHHARGPSYWRVPRWLLMKEEVKDDIKVAALELLETMTESNNPGVIWSAWKSRMKHQLQWRGKMLRSQFNRKREALRKEVEDLAKAKALSPDSPRATIDWYYAKSRYDALCREWNFVHNTEKFDYVVASTETSSKAFFRQVGPKLRQIPLDEVELPNGDTTSDPDSVYETFQQHWGGYFGDSRFADRMAGTIDEGAKLTLLDSITRKLKPEQAGELDEPLTVEEFEQAIKEMRGDGAPGPDGFSARFFQIDPAVFGKILHTVFMDQMRRGQLLKEQQHSAVILLFKKGSRAKPGNYRPISLMPVEVKVLSRVLVSRMKGYVAKLVHTDQKGFIPGRSIHHQIILVKDVLHYCSTANVNGYASFLDFEKAYDMVNWDYLFEVLKRQGFGPNLISWIQLMYSKPSCSLILNGWLQPRLSPTRGVKQGDPLSPYLFILSLEPLGNLLRRENHLGLQLPFDRRITGAFFADDSVLFSSSNAATERQLDQVRTYCAGSGARLNVHKSSMLILNTNESISGPYPLPHTDDNDTVRYLGIDIGRREESGKELRLLDSKIVRALSHWRYRARTVQGRILLVSTLVLSLIWYKALHLNVPSKYVKRWQGLVNRFVLNKKVESDAKGISLIPGQVACQPKRNGGLGIPDIELFLTRQRMRIFQQFATVAHKANRDSIDTWALLPIWTATQDYQEDASGQLSDIFYQSHSKSAHKLRTSWWNKSWKVWFNLTFEIPSDSHRDQWFAGLLHAPLFWSSVQTLQFENRNLDERKLEPIATGSPGYTRFCKCLLLSGFRTLRDFLLPSGHLRLREEIGDRLQHLPQIVAIRHYQYHLSVLYMKILQVVELPNRANQETNEENLCASELQVLVSSKPG
ncbi:Rna-directed dna polymerase, partial [Globisporangium splendens]